MRRLRMRSIALTLACCLSVFSIGAPSVAVAEDYPTDRVATNDENGSVAIDGGSELSDFNELNETPMQGANVDSVNSEVVGDVLGSSANDPAVSEGMTGEPSDPVSGSSDSLDVEAGCNDDVESDTTVKSDEVQTIDSNEEDLSSDSVFEFEPAEEVEKDEDLEVAVDSESAVVSDPSSEDVDNELPADSEDVDSNKAILAEDDKGVLFEDEDGYTFVLSSGEVLADEFYTIDGVTYYFNSKGYAVGGLLELDDKVYYFDEQTFAQIFDLYTWEDGTRSYFAKNKGGAAAKAWWIIGGDRYYFDPVTRKTLLPGYAQIGGKYYLIQDSGSVYMGMHRWEDGTVSYFSKNNDGAAAKRWWTLDGYRYYFDPETRRTPQASSGLNSIEGSFYKVTEDGYVFIGLYDWDEGTLSYFSPSHGGAAAKFKWTVDGRIYYFDELTRQSVIGWHTWSNGKRSYLAPSYQGAAAKNRWTIDNKLYFFDPETRCAITGWHTWTNGKRSYFSKGQNCAAAQGWWTLGGKKYYFKRDTRETLKGKWSISGQYYYFDSTGAMFTGWIEWNDGSGWSYFAADGAMVTGSQVIDGVDYNFGTDGKVAHYLSDAQLRVIEACKTTPSPGGGLCAAWVTYVFQNADIGSWGGNADDMYFAYCKTSPSKIKPGMIIAVDSSPASAAGRIYGHVAVYIGNGKVMDNIGSIRTISLDEWVEYYSALSTPKCGWFGKVDLTV
ncbi:N-acetylmuramoyl-L-alanine amidase family protein [Collinsella tanakaei]|uniref:N-acetylmuramoyl-L-alanine amidase family protein n=1 Tax=Collinsella tanakaei TaxID=626935 RepID=UPI0025A404CE|nr:hypothetical protein [Collinsella tanakaei]MDM8302939.1 hypothetical protein [Collinsella tanakaei]